MRRPALFPRQTFRLQTSETDGFEPSRPSLRPGRSQLLAHSVNPDSRVSKVFIVLCLPLSDFHGNIDSFIRRCYQSVELTNEYAGNCTRFSTSRFRSNLLHLFLLRTYSQRKEDMKRKRKQKLLISKPYKVHHTLQDYSITF